MNYKFKFTVKGESPTITNVNDKQLKEIIDELEKFLAHHIRFINEAGFFNAG